MQCQWLRMLFRDGDLLVQPSLQMRLQQLRGALCNPSHPPYWLGKLGGRSTAADGQALAGEEKHGVAESKDVPGALGEVGGRFLSVSLNSYACALPKTKPSLVNEDLVYQWVIRGRPRAQV